MTYGTLRDLLTESALSFEQFAERLGVCGMTMRRWQRRARNTQLPKLYARATRDVVYELIVEGNIKADSPIVLAILRETASLSSAAALTGLGFSPQFLASAVADSGSATDSLVVELGHIGANSSIQTRILESETAIRSFLRHGKDWLQPITTLIKVVKSPVIAPLDKLVAFGALFYLLTPLDLIPDFIPGVGLVDDFGILCLAVAYYCGRFPYLKAEMDEGDDLASAWGPRSAPV